MGLKAKICVVLLLLAAVVLVSANRSEREPALGRCKLRCEQESDVLGCKKQCEKEYLEKQKREREGGHSRGGDDFNIVLADIEQDFPKIVERCHRRCQGSQGEQELPRCFQICMQQESQQHGTRKPGDMRKERGKRSGEQQQSNNPYVFEDRHFTTQLETEQGNIRVLQKFTDRSELFQGIEKYRVAILEAEPQTFVIPNHWDADALVYVVNDRHFTTQLETEQGNIRVLQKFTDRSELFQGIEKYRVAILEAEPQTFVIPNHWDADALVYVVNGKGTISLINPNSQQNHNIKQGDIFRLPAGITAYLINRDNNEKLVLAKILRTVTVPGELQNFFSIGGGNPESSFLNAFSTEILEAAFNVNRDSLEIITGQQKQQRQQQEQQGQGIFKKATQEQIRTLTGKDEGRTWPFGERKGPYNIYKKNPSVANDNGNLYEVDSDDFSDLREINVAFSFFNITQGSIAGPFYNTKATTVLLVTSGQGQFEMACPHLSEQASRSTSEFNPSYQKVNSQLTRGTIVVIPAGHPIVIEASPNQDIEVIGFGLNSDKNEWFPVVGRDGVISQYEDEALELTFGVPANEVKTVLQKQNQRLFFKGPARRGRAFA